MDIEIIREKVIKNLKLVYDPEIPVNIYDLGLIYDVDLAVMKNNELFCYITMTLTSPSCPVAEGLVEQVRVVANAVDEVDSTIIDLTFFPAWEKSMISDEAKEIMETSGAII